MGAHSGRVLTTNTPVSPSFPSKLLTVNSINFAPPSSALTGRVDVAMKAAAAVAFGERRDVRFHRLVCYRRVEMRLGVYEARMGG
eukprot:scaffold71251_cov30-Cyclotella_meneghiniana.AAC.1